jgi:UDPglucose 6-dehydrogenase
MNAVVIGGLGIVGQSTRHALGIYNYYDLSGSNVYYKDLNQFKYIFLCLPTPVDKNGEYKIGDIKKVITDIKGNPDKNIFILRSTVSPGTCKKLAEETKQIIVHVPEFLTESTWKEDSEWPDIVVIGADNSKIRKEIEGLFRSRFRGANFILTDTITSETIKVSINSFYALKVVFANQIYDFCQKSGANYETVKEAMYARKWIGKNHLDVWHKGGRGASGKCLLKDLDAFANSSKLPLLEIANVLNKELVKEFPKKE